MHTITLEGPADFDGWRVNARSLALAGVPPQDTQWRVRGGDDGGLFDMAPAEPEALPPGLMPPPGTGLTVPKDFIELAKAVVCHSDPARFGLLYRLLWRMQSEKGLIGIATDADVVRARGMQKSVRRDCHKMTAFVRFKEVPHGQGQGRSGQNPRRRFIAWFEPDHYIVERTAPFFQRRFTDMDWLILTPHGSSAWDGQALRLSPLAASKPDISDETDDLWRTYFSNIFNPARLKVKAMQAEMPKKYWKNLPEASLIPDLIADAEASVRAMVARAASQPPAHHFRLQEAMRNAPAPDLPPAGTLAALKEQAKTCTRCPLHCTATQTVFGEGPEAADVMFVGEQPGDQEDLAGRPFIGPAGKLFDTVLEQTGIDRKTAYVTNAVKHFKYEPRGKKRIHQRPNTGEIEHCRLWLKLELDLIKPKLVVALGATALHALTGEKSGLSQRRGQFQDLGHGQSLFTTIHPSYLLRIPDLGKQGEERLRFEAELAQVARAMQAPHFQAGGSA